MEHRYLGNSTHSFWEYNSNCKWCGKMNREPYKILVRIKEQSFESSHRVLTPYCSPKCFHEHNPEFMLNHFKTEVEYFVNYKLKDYEKAQQERFQSNKKQSKTEEKEYSYLFQFVFYAFVFIVCLWYFIVKDSK
jgi:hypothetical protein